MLSFVVLLSACQSVAPAELPEPYTQRQVVHGIPILATEQVHEDYVALAGLVYEHMTSRAEPVDLRALHRESGFRILLLTEQESFLDLPEFAGEDEDIDQAGGLGGCIGEFLIAVRVGSPHALVHEIGHGIYHSAIQFGETGGADDEEAWYAERVRAVHDCEFEEAVERFGEEQIHEVLLAPEGTFSADLAAAWRNADAQDLWQDDYAGAEPNEYWAEGVALWFRAWSEAEEGVDTRVLLGERDPMLHALCARIFPDTDWHPGLAHAATGGEVYFVDEHEEETDEPDLFGGAILRTPTGSAPDDLRQVTAVYPSEHPPFGKDLVACGVVFAAEESVPDAFLERVGQTIAEMFRADVGIDAKLQDAVLTHLYRYEALLPVPSTERSFERLFDEHGELMDEVQSTHSVCDIIMAAVPRGQVMEVVEHILHAVTDVGLHHVFPDEWGLSRNSDLWHAMQTAIDAGLYDISSYDDLRGAPQEVVDRVLMQEFAYWFLTTAWDLQLPYGPNEREWTLRTPAELREALPLFFAVHERTSARVLSPPTLETLAGFGRTRGEER
jgi:hypothetical protein